MKKRIVCALLTLILLLGLVPATALTASAASLKTSEAAITVLKQLEGFSGKCDENGYIGYHTKCAKKGTHGDVSKPHTIGQTAADEALREELASLDKAINSFASSNGLSLSQNKHDALVLFSFQNGTSWVNGAGGFRAAVVNGKRGDDFLNAILDWSNRDDDTRRKVEANMYLNGIYAITAPTNFISVTFDANGGTINGENKRTYYYDASGNPQPHLVPTRKDFTFTGWYCEGKLVTGLTTAFNGKTLTARWMDDKNMPWSAEGTAYKVALTQLVSQNVYNYTVDKEDSSKITFSLFKDGEDNVVKAEAYATEGYLSISKEYIDKDGTKWGIIQGVSLWVKLPGSAASSSTTEGNAIDVTVKVTNSYLNRRSDASIYGTKNGSYDLGTSLRIIDTASSDGFLWGKVAQNATGSESVGWVALMYTDYDTVRNQSNSFTTGSVIATGFITYNGYVNVRSNAGTVNSIVGSLYKGTQVNIYETKYVNGLEWGRTDIGWFCMSYANVTRLTKEQDNSTDINYVSYVFTGTTKWDSNVYEAPGVNVLPEKVKAGTAVTITAFAEEQGTGATWGKISQGWILVSNVSGEAQDVILDPAKFTVVSEVTVRNYPGNNSERVNTLSKNVSFQVNSARQVVVTGENLWGYATVLDGKTSGWINLSSKYVKRDDAPTVEGTSTPTGKIATIVGADSVRVRGDSSLSGKVIGSIKQGATVNILDERNGWYKIDYKCTDEEGVDSWVYGQYVQVSEGTVSGGTTGTATDGTGVGIIANTYGGVNLRATPGTAGALKGKILPGTQVNILETRTVGTAKWGRVENGWICMDYVQIISDLPADVLAALGVGNAGTGSSSTTTGAEVAMYTGTVATEGGVTVYAEPDKNSTVIRALGQDEKVTVHELKTVVTSETVGTTGGSDALPTDLAPGDTTTESDGSTTTTIQKTTTYWARVNDGYIINPETNLDLDTLDEAVYTVTETDTLNVRDVAGTSGEKVFKLLKGDQVKVTNVKIVGGSVWGNVECDEGTGWASLAYMTKGAVSANTGNNNNGATGTTGNTGTTTGATGTVTGSTGNTGAVSASGYLYTGKVINTDSVRVRNTASTTATVSTNLKRGASLVIYETVLSEGMAWGRCDAGWVYLYYVDMTPVNGSGAVDARVVYNDNTLIYADKDGSSTVGTYAKMAVIDIYEIVGKMARTDLGWVSTDNLL